MCSRPADIRAVQGGKRIETGRSSFAIVVRTPRIHHPGSVFEGPNQLARRSATFGNPKCLRFSARPKGAPSEWVVFASTWNWTIRVYADQQRGVGYAAVTFGVAAVTALRVNAGVLEMASSNDAIQACPAHPVATSKKRKRVETMRSYDNSLGPDRGSGRTHPRSCRSMADRPDSSDLNPHERARDGRLPDGPAAPSTAYGIDSCSNDPRTGGPDCFPDCSQDSSRAFARFIAEGLAGKARARDLLRATIESLSCPEGLTPSASSPHKGFEETDACFRDCPLCTAMRALRRTDRLQRSRLVERLERQAITNVWLSELLQELAHATTPSGADRVLC
jgi:hypothetical protein